MVKRLVIMLVVIAAVGGGLYWFKAIFVAGKIKEALSGLATVPQTVATVTAGYQDWTPTTTAIGNVRAVNGIDISSQVAGKVAAVHFESGQMAKAGDLLVELAAADDEARLASSQAVANLAQITYQRDQRQLQAQAVSQQVVDADEQNLKNAQAQVALAQATLDFKRIHAPFGGRLGLRAVDPGQYVAAGTAIVSLQQVDPILVEFLLPTASLGQVVVGQDITAVADAYSGLTFPGKVVAFDAKVDTATRNITVRASFPNPDGKLVPGMFVNVSIVTGKPARFITLPQTAITFNPYGATVYLVDKAPGSPPKLTARQAFVTTGATRGDQIEVLTGVKDGDTVVAVGQNKLHNGSALAVNNSVLPANDANPKPVDQ